MIFKYDPEKELAIFEKMAADGRFHTQTVKMWQKEFAEVKFEKGCVFLEKQVSLCEQNWKEVEENYLTKMSEFFEKKCEIPEEMTCFLVRYTTFPYSIESEWFMAPLYGSPADRNRVIMHELCHFFTPGGVSKSLKEALPVILNEADTFKMYSVDRGNTKDEEEMRLRPAIQEMYRKGFRFTEIYKTLENK